ncbi:Vgb family protein [Caulifigura coniformis]|nr:hypothetical protein [Caulifigura coniformis]
MPNSSCIATPVQLSLASLVLALCAASSVEAATLRGTVQSGEGRRSTPLSEVAVTLYEATTGAPTVVGEATTDRSGKFTISTPSKTSSSIFFVTADVGDGALLVTILGPDLPSRATVNELTTVAASYSMAQFYRTGVISGNSFGLRIAAGMSNNIASPETGESSRVLQKSPNADETNSLRLTRSLGNLMAACVSYSLVRSTFFGLTTPEGGTAPENTAVALANLARDPGKNVELIFALTLIDSSYYSGLFGMPDAWTVAVKVNDSGSNRYMFGGPAAIAFDTDGNAWIANNVVQGGTQSAKHVMVLKPNGEPSDGKSNTPKSPLSGGGILGVGLGVTIDPFGSAWFSNFGWGGDNPTEEGNGSVSQFLTTGKAVSPKDAYQGGPVRGQGIQSDDQGNIWISSLGNDSVFVFPGGDPCQSSGVELYPGSQPFGMAIAPDGSAWVTASGGILGEHPSAVGKFHLNGEGEAELDFIHFVGNALKAIIVDSAGNAWFSSQGDSTVYAYSPDGTQIGAFSGDGGVFHPWGITVDGEDNIWVANFGPLELDSNFTQGRVSRLCGANPAGWPPGKTLGDPLSPDTGYTLPSAGSEVLLANGTPLYGKNSEPSYAPLMRQTGLSIDQAGNVWTCNNWKPRFRTDITSNPGGDGIVIFVGLAPPPAKLR